VSEFDFIALVFWDLFYYYPHLYGGVHLAEALCYKPKGRRFDFR
jgi:hypothetical protein